MTYELICERLRESIAVKQSLLEDQTLLNAVAELSQEIINCFQRGGKLVLCGNGGSASDALHFAGELVGRFQRERPAWPAVVLNADVATMTAVSNDYGYENIFARQVCGLVSERDMFIGISTSGNSENIIRAVKAAKERGAKCAAFLGGNGGKIAQEVDFPVTVPCSVTARVQECHICLIHILCELTENALSEE